MGIPRFYIELLKKYKDTHFSDPNFKVHNLFMDYNAFIYPVRAEFFKQKSYDEFSKLSVAKREQELANFVVEKTIEFINEISPEKLLYIAFDGPAPRSKMKLQRDRRYKSVKEETYFEELRKTFGVEEKNTSSLINSAALSPGTTLMKKIADGLRNAANKKKFMEGKILVIVDDTNIPGEGEHKILKFIRYLKNLEEHVCVYSPDADVIILSMQYEGNIYVIQPRDRKKEEHRQLYPNDSVKNIFFSIPKYREAIKKEIGDFKELNDVNLVRDFTLLTFFIGNDFVKPIYFTKSNKDRSFDSILNIYKRLLKKYKNTKNPYLVEIRKNNEETYPYINKDFLVNIFQELAKMEDIHMKEYYNKILKESSKEQNDLKDEISFEDKKAAFEHGLYYLPYVKDRKTGKYIKDNPFYDPDLIKVIDYNEPRNVWNNKYYSFFFNILPDNPREFIKYKKLICYTYLKSLLYCLRYYLTGLPSWDWYYPFRVAPMPSDIIYFMNDMPKDLNFKFELGEPYSPIEQLSMILPPQNISILPRPIRLLITNAYSPLAPYYPVDFELDKVFGEKYIYSYALLPSFVDEIVRPQIQNTFSKFTKSEQERNKLESKYYIYEPNNISINNLTHNVP
jgi:5'-3' exonuclease